MKFIVENWFVIVAIAAVGGSIGYAIYSFVKMPSDKQLSYSMRNDSLLGKRIKPGCNYACFSAGIDGGS